MMRSKFVMAALAIALVSGCATRPENIASAHVSTSGYNNMNCSQLRNEAAEVSNAAMSASAMQQKKATGDAVAMGVGLVLFWPAVFFIGGDGAQSAEVARLKGEMNAIQTVARRKGCPINLQKV